MLTIDEVYFLVRVGTWDQQALTDYINQEVQTAMDQMLADVRDTDDQHFHQGQRQGYDEGFRDGRGAGYDDGFAAGESQGYGHGQRDADNSTGWGR